MEKIKIHVDLESGRADRAPETSRFAPCSPITLEPLTTHAHPFKLVRTSLTPILIFTAVLVIEVVGVAGHWKFLTNELSAFLGVVCLVCMAWIAVGWIDCVNDEFRVETERVISVHRSPFGSERERIALLRKIQTVEISRKNPIAFLLNYGDVAINVGESILNFEYIPEPKAFRDRIFAGVAALEEADRRAAAESQREFIEEVVSVFKSRDPA